MSLLYIDSDEAAKICSTIEQDFGLDIDEFEPVDEETFNRLSDELRDAVSPESHVAFLKCFESDPSDGYYFKASGREEFLEKLDEAYNQD